MFHSSVSQIAGRVVKGTSPCLCLLHLCWSREGNHWPEKVLPLCVWLQVVLLDGIDETFTPPEKDQRDDALERGVTYFNTL